MFQILFVVSGFISGVLCLAILFALLWQSPLIIGLMLVAFFGLSVANYKHKRRPTSMDEGKP